jgi:hypothetical protein
LFELYANKYFIVNQLITLNAKTFFFPGPECLCRIGCASRIGGGGNGAEAGQAPKAEGRWGPAVAGAYVAGQDAGSIGNGTAPTFRLGAAFIFCRRTCKPEKTKKLKIPFD